MAEPAFTPEAMKAAIAQVKSEGADQAQPAGASQDALRAAIAQVKSEPAPRQDALGAIERMAATRAKEEPDRLEKILKDRGFSTKRKGNEVLIDQAGKFVPWDPVGADLLDLADLVPEALELGTAVVAGGAKVLGAVGAPLTGGASLAAGTALAGVAGAGLETAFQGAELAGGFREELDPGQIGSKALSAATIPGAGAAVGKVGGAIGKQVGKATEAVAKKTAEGATKARLDKVSAKQAALTGKPRGLSGVGGGRQAGQAAKGVGQPASANLSKGETKNLGKIASRVGVALLDAKRMLGGDFTPIVRRIAMSKLKKMSPDQLAALGAKAGKAGPKTKGLAAITGVGAKVGSSESMEAFAQSILKESK